MQWRIQMLVQKEAVYVQAWQLGAHSEKEEELITNGRIKLHVDGNYEIFSQEATGKTGQIAKPGDYFKVALSGEPYPNERIWFERMHKHIRDDWYEQNSVPLQAWTVDEPINDTIQFLLDQSLLKINTSDPAHYFSASLWGTIETAAKNAVIIIHHVEKNNENEIISVNFNFVAREEFDKTYRVLSHS